MRIFCHALSGLLMIGSTSFAAMAQEAVRSEIAPPAATSQRPGEPAPTREIPVQPPMGSGAPEPMPIGAAPLQPPIAVAPAQAEFRIQELPVQPPITSDAHGVAKRASQPLPTQPPLPSQPPLAPPPLK